MVFSSTIFLFVFLPVVLAGYYLLDRRFKNIFLLVASFFFYAWGEPKFVLVMIASILVNYLFGLLVVRRQNKLYQRTILICMVLFNLSLFFVFKYLDFTVRNLNAVFGDILPQTDIALPIGISFFTFQAMSYVFDVYRGKGSVQKNPFDVALYIAFFPQLIAGPIVRYETVAREIGCRKETLDDFAKGIRRFILGLSKKVILSNSFAILADKAFGCTDFSQLPVLLAWLGAVAYTLQIYYDFGGYSDMAIGLGLMFGFHFDENFNYPYISKSVSEFWRRWHISLGSWFRDYVYFPLGGSRVSSKGRLVLNLFVVWFLTGVWHGAAWNFIVWGVMYFALISFEKLSGYPSKFHHTSSKLAYQAFAMLMVVCGWVLFRANGMWNTLGYLGSMFGLTNNTLSSPLSIFLLRDSTAILLLGVIGSTPLFSRAYALVKNRFGICVDCGAGLLLGGILILCIAYAVNTAYDPFIYFNF